MNKRPPFIPRDCFRQWMPAKALNEFFQVGGILPASFVQRRERLGRPIRRNASGWVRPIDVVAAAAADGFPISPSRADELEQIMKTRLLEESQRVSRADTHAFCDRLLVSFSGRRMASREEIIEMAINPGAPIVGVYFLIAGTEVVYVGQSRNVCARIQAHVGNKIFDKIAVLRVEAAELDFVESVYIHALGPRLNGPPPKSLAQLAEFNAKPPTRRRGVGPLPAVVIEEGH